MKPRHDILKTTQALLEGCVVRADDGTRLYTPDGRGNYRALWTRDFAYMLHGAIDLMPLEDVRACIECLIAGAREDGWIPDRVEPDGTPRYTAGDEFFPALPNLDTGPYLALAADEYLSRLEPKAALRQFAAWENALCRGLACLPVAENGLIENGTEPPHSPYGFTDCVAKTGLLAMESLLLWAALRVVARWKQAAGEDASAALAACRRIEAAFAETLTDPETGLLFSATGACRQRDLWASCYAVYLGFPLERGQDRRISRWLAAHDSEVVEAGQLRHLPAGEYWENLFVPVNPGEYQNGAFWATPIEWLCAALAVCDPPLAKRTLDDLLDYFDDHGVFECVNGDLRRLDTYVASATNALAAQRLLGRAPR